MMLSSGERESENIVLLVQRNLNHDFFPFLSLFLGVCLLWGNWFQQESWVAVLGGSWSSFVLESRWWVIISSILLHSSKLHFMGNLVLLLFLGFRVEHALGTRHLFWLCMTSVCVSTVSTWCWGDGTMIVGASALVFGIWGAQIAIGFCFALNEQQEHRYGWWGLLLLAIVFSFQIREQGVGHGIHFCSVLVGTSYVVILRMRGSGPVFSLISCMLALGVAVFGTEAFLKRESIQGMDVLIPKDFVSWEGHDVRIWFHPFHGQGWMLSGVHEEEEFREWWQKRGFLNKGTGDCHSQKNCSIFSAEEEAQIRFVHYGRQLYWVSCVHPLDVNAWRSSCSLLLESVKPTIPDSLERARNMYREHPQNLYYMESFVIQLEGVGKYTEALQVLESVQGTEWEERANIFRENILMRIDKQKK